MGLTSRKSASATFVGATLRSVLNLQPIELLIVLTVVIGIPVAIGLGLYWVIRKAVADGRRDTMERQDT